MNLAAKTDIGSYVCHAKNHLGEASAVTSLVVISVPKFITKPPQTVIKLLGDDLSLNRSASGEPAPAVTWKRSTGAWNDGRMKVQRGSLQISRLDKTDSGIYICEGKVPYYTIEARSHLLVAGRYLRLFVVFVNKNGAKIGGKNRGIKSLEHYVKKFSLNRFQTTETS